MADALIPSLLLAMGATVAAAGVGKAVARRGSSARSGKRAQPDGGTETLAFFVHLDGDWADEVLSMPVTVLIEWDGDPATYPTQQEILDEYVADSGHEDLDDAARADLKDDLPDPGDAQAVREIELTEPDTWLIQAVNVHERVLLGGHSIAVLQMHGTPTKRHGRLPPGWTTNRPFRGN